MPRPLLPLLLLLLQLLLHPRAALPLSPASEGAGHGDSAPYISPPLSRAHTDFVPPTFKWEPLQYNFSLSAEERGGLEPAYGGQKASDIAGIPVYAVVATMARRISHIADVITAILSGTVAPTHTYLMISEEGFLLDGGVPRGRIPIYLRFLVSSGHLSIVYTDNIGPHRKLLPLLSRMWTKDVIIITLDDDRKMPRDALQRLLKYYVHSDRDSIVGLRVRRVGFCATYRYAGTTNSSTSSKKSKKSTNSTSSSSTSTSSSTSNSNRNSNSNTNTRRLQSKKSSKDTHTHRGRGRRRVRRSRHGHGHGSGSGHGKERKGSSHSHKHPVGSKRSGSSAGAESGDGEENIAHTHAHARTNSKSSSSSSSSSSSAEAEAAAAERREIYLAENPDRSSRVYRVGLAEYGACRWPRVQNRFVTKEMLVLPTGNGGVLYRPRFMHPVVFDTRLRELTQWNDDLTFRLASMANGVMVVPGCCDDDFSYCADLFTSLTEAVKRKSSLYDQNTARNSKMWSAALTYLQGSNTNTDTKINTKTNTNTHTNIYTNTKTNTSSSINISPFRLRISDLILAFLPSERSLCGLDRDSPLKALSKKKTHLLSHPSNFSGPAALKRIVGGGGLSEAQRKALWKEGNKCGVHWCNTREKERNEEEGWVVG